MNHEELQLETVENITPKSSQRFFTCGEKKPPMFIFALSEMDLHIGVSLRPKLARGVRSSFCDALRRFIRNSSHLRDMSPPIYTHGLYLSQPMYRLVTF